MNWSKCILGQQTGSGHLGAHVSSSIILLCIPCYCRILHYLQSTGWEGWKRLVPEIGRRTPGLLQEQLTRKSLGKWKTIGQCFVGSLGPMTGDGERSEPVPLFPRDLNVENRQG